MEKFRKLPVIVEAVQFDGSIESAGEITDMWLSTCFPDCDPTGKYLGKLKVITLEGVVTAEPGDWIIEGAAGERYPIKDSIFRATYEPAATVDAVTNLQAVVDAQAAELAAARERERALEEANGQLGLTVSELQNNLNEWEEREASCCPEDVGFEDVIARLRSRLQWTLCTEHYPVKKGVYLWAVPYSDSDKCYIVTSYFDPAWLPFATHNSFAWMEIPKLPEAK